jgi:hypothetical protein
MVQTSKPRPCNNAAPRCGPISSSGPVFFQTKMSSILVKVGNVLGEKSLQMPLTHSNNVVKQLAPTNRPRARE